MDQQFESVSFVSPVKQAKQQLLQTVSCPPWVQSHKGSMKCSNICPSATELPSSANSGCISRALLKELFCRAGDLLISSIISTGATSSHEELAALLLYYRKGIPLRENSSIRAGIVLQMMLQPSTAYMQQATQVDFALLVSLFLILNIDVFNMKKKPMTNYAMNVLHNIPTEFQKERNQNTYLMMQSSLS